MVENRATGGALSSLVPQAIQTKRVGPVPTPGSIFDN